MSSRGLRGGSGKPLRDINWGGAEVLMVKALPIAGGAGRVTPKIRMTAPQLIIIDSPACATSQMKGEYRKTRRAIRAEEP